MTKKKGSNKKKKTSKAKKNEVKQQEPEIVDDDYIEIDDGALHVVIDEIDPSEILELIGGKVTNDKVKDILDKIVESYADVNFGCVFACDSPIVVEMGNCIINVTPDSVKNVMTVMREYINSYDGATKLENLIYELLLQRTKEIIKTNKDMQDELMIANIASVYLVMEYVIDRIDYINITEYNKERIVNMIEVFEDLLRYVPFKSDVEGLGSDEDVMRSIDNMTIYRLIGAAIKLYASINSVPPIDIINTFKTINNKVNKQTKDQVYKILDNMYINNNNIYDDAAVGEVISLLINTMMKNKVPYLSKYSILENLRYVLRELLYHDFWLGAGYIIDEPNDVINIEYYNKTSDEKHIDKDVVIDMSSGVYADGCPLVANKVDVKMTYDCYVKIQRLLDHFEDVEFGVYLLDEDDDGVIDNIYIPEQEVGPATFDVEDLTNVPEKTVGVMHSHVNMGAFFSCKDDDYLNDNFDISIVMNRKYEYKCAVRIRTDCGRYAHVNGELVVVNDIEKVFGDELSRIKRRVYAYSKSSYTRAKSSVKNDDIPNTGGVGIYGATGKKRPSDGYYDPYNDIYKMW